VPIGDLAFLTRASTAVDFTACQGALTFSQEDKMKKIVTTILLGLLLPVSVCAGQIYGSLTEGGRPVPANVEFEIKCGEQTYPRGKTDGYGAYSINVGRGKCTFTVYYKNQAPTSVLYSYDRSVRYNFELEAKNGQYELKRK
jgi:hypothetical protein